MTKEEKGVTQLTLLQVEKLTKRFGGVKAVDQVDFQVNEGEIVGLIGPNGAGKSTLFATITGYLRADGGKVNFNGQNILGLRPDQIARKGIVRTFQIVKPINDMTVLENTIVGALMHTSNISKAYAQAREVLEFVELNYKADSEIHELTLGDKKRLEIARAIASEPKLLLLDEVMSGLNAVETHQAVELVKKINKQLHITLIIVEHVMEVIMPLCYRILVLNYGVKILEGSPNEILNNPNVIRAYLGNPKDRRD
jgi:branched-chain amino acid transport system ATP-binding protein